MNKLILFALFAIVSSIGYDKTQTPFKLFQDFMVKYEKQYENVDEFTRRFKIFQQNLERPSYAQGRWEEGITKFFDLTPEEFKRMYRNYKPNKKSYIRRTEAKRADNPPENFNWVDEGIVPGVKDQASCGSCWAFSACGNIECQYKKTHGVFETCSEQMLVDCDYEESGCDGGMEVDAAKWVKKNGGIMNGADYPYRARDQTCRKDPSKYKIKVADVIQMRGTNEDDMRDYLLEHGPLMIAMNADPLQFYHGGIIDVSVWECDPDSIDHALVLVGYGISNGKKFWIVRNSWGATWGERGYFKIVRGKGACGINLEAATALVQ